MISSSYSKTGILWEAFRSKYGKEDKKTLVWRAGTLDMNPGFNKEAIETAIKADLSVAKAEYFSEFRQDLEGYISTENLDAIIVPGRMELPRLPDVSYSGFVDSSGGRQDAMTLSICHREGDDGLLIQDALRETFPPFDPALCAEDYCKVLKDYGVCEVTGDRYAAEWCSSAFEKHGISYKNSELSKSEIYLEFLPLAMQRRVELLDHTRQMAEFRQLERRTGRGRDYIDHPPGCHDDTANAGAGSIVLAARYEDGPAIGISEVDWME